MNYTGQVCTGCAKVISEEDDIVVCPVCGTPQHRECWEINGECVNVSRHAEKFVWQAAQEEPKTANAAPEADKGTSQRCVSCGAGNTKEALTCVNCGAPLFGEQGQNPMQSFFNVAGTVSNPFLYGVTLDPESEIEGAKVKDIACYVQSASSRYIHMFKELADKRKKFSFNWGAFFFGPYWFFYRKMWKVGLIFAGVLLAVALAFSGVVQDFEELYYAYIQMDPDVVPADKIIDTMDLVYDSMFKILPMFAVQLVVGIVGGFVADGLYKKQVIKGVKTLREQFPADRAYEGASLKRGGTSIFIAFAAYLGYNVIYNLLLNLAALLIN